MSKINKDNKFTQLVQKNKLKFYKTAKAILKNDDDVYDAIQNALMSMYQNFNNLKEQKYFATWGVRIVINKCYDLLRKNKKIELYDELEECVTEDNYNLDYNGINKLVNGLDKNLYLIVILYYYDDFSIKEIAEILEMPEGTIKSKLSKARSNLRKNLEKEGICYGR